MLLTFQKSLETKRDHLLIQLKEAKLLNENIDRRGKFISHILQQALNPDEFSDHDYFLNKKIKLIVKIREITDKMKLCEDQKNALKETLAQTEC